MSDNRVRRRIAGLSIFCAPLLILIAEFVGPEPSRHASVLVSRTVGHVDATFVAGTLGLIGAILLVPAAMGFMHLLRERAHHAEVVGGTLAIVGAVCLAVFSGMRILLAEMGDLISSGAAAGPYVNLVERVTDPTGIMVALYVGVAAFAAGYLVMGYAFIRCGTAPKLASLLLAAGAVVAVVGHMMYSTTTFLVGDIMLALGMLAIGAEVLFETDEEWEHPRDHVGWTNILPQH